MMDYLECAAANSAARFGDRKPEAQERRSSAFFMPAVRRQHGCQLMAVRVGSPSGLPVSLGAGSPTWHAPPPFWRGVVASSTQGDNAMTEHIQGPTAPLSAADLFAAVFHPNREPRSEAYRAGCLAALRVRLGELARVRCPYRLGTAEADAFHAGVAEGHARAREGQGVRHD